VRKVLTWLGWIVGGLLGLVVCLYLILLGINWRDSEPSTAALRFDALYRDRPPVADADNGFVYMYGFSASRDEDPRAVGARRIERLQRTAGTPEFSGEDDPASEDTEYRALRSPQIRALIEACRLTTAECVAKLESDEASLQEWVDSESWLLARYQRLLKHGGWLETAPFDERMPVTEFSTVMDGQRLYLAKVILLASMKDAAGVRELLADDLRFWRMTLASSDILVSRMIAAAALLRTFKTGNVALRQLPAELVTQGMPSEWDQPLAGPELSLRRTLVGEWMFGRALARREASRAGEWIYEGDLDSVRTVLGILGSPLYKQQNSANLQAGQFEELLTAMDVPLRQYPQAIARLESGSPEEGDPPLRLFNPVGNALFVGTASQYVPYVVRVSDIEGVRRAAVLTSRLRSRKVPPDLVATELAASDIRNPYTDGAFEWDFEAHAIVFWGLEKSERGRHSLKY
jgi:hypothetical protein